MGRYITMASAHALLGNHRAATDALAAVLRRQPKVSVPTAVSALGLSSEDIGDRLPVIAGS